MLIQAHKVNVQHHLCNNGFFIFSFEITDFNCTPDSLQLNFEASLYDNQ